MYASSIWHMHVITFYEHNGIFYRSRYLQLVRWSRLDESSVVLLFLSVSSAMYFYCRQSCQSSWSWFPSVVTFGFQVGLM